MRIGAQRTGRRSSNLYACSSPADSSGPPEAAFARSLGATWVLRTIMGVLSYGVRANARRRHVR